MFVSSRISSKSKAALGLLVTVFVASACSHQDIKDADLKDQPEVSDQAGNGDQNLPAPTPVFATEPGNSFEEAKTEEVAPAPVKADEPAPMPSMPSKKISHHKKAKKSSKHSKLVAKKHGRHHKKQKKIAKNHKMNKKSIEQASGAAMGSVSQLPPPPPAPPAPEMLPPPPPAPPAPDFNSQPMVQVDQGSSSFPWVYIVIAAAAGLIGLGIRYRSKFSKKSRRLVFAK